MLLCEDWTADKALVEIFTRRRVRMEEPDPQTMDHARAAFPLRSPTPVVVRLTGTMWACQSRRGISLWTTM